MKSSSHKAVVMLAALSLLIAFRLDAPAQFDERERWATGRYEPWNLNYQRYSRTDVLAAQEKWKQLEADDETGEWAGEYSLVCDFCEVSLDKLRWSPQSGFIKFHVYTCQPELRALDFGSVVETPTTAQMIPEYPSGTGRSARPGSKFLKVKWGERRYLIAEDRIAAFCDRIAGLEARDDLQPLKVEDFYLKDGDEAKPTMGLPTLPNGYRHLLRKPIAAKVIAVGESKVEFKYEDVCEKRTIVPVMLNAGRASGLTVGMSLQSPDEKIAYGFTITSVGKRSSRAVYTLQDWRLCAESEDASDAPDESAAEPQEQESEPEIKVGLELSTRILP